MKYKFVGGPLDGGRHEVKNPSENILIPKMHGWLEFVPVRYCRMSVGGEIAYRYHEISETEAKKMLSNGRVGDDSRN